MRQPEIKLLVFVVCLTVLITNCSSPLDPSSLGQPAPPAIITITDTIVDTLIQNGTDTLIDTVIQTEIDTVFVTDTLIDTVFVDISDTAQGFEACGKIGICKKKLVWHFANSAGRYRVQLVAQRCDKLLPRELTAVIDGVEYPWRPGKSDTLTVDQFLSANAFISVQDADWSGWTSAARVCVTLTPL